MDIPIIRRLWHRYRDHLAVIDSYDLGGETVEPELKELASLYGEENGGVYLAMEHEDVLGTVALNRIGEDAGEVRRLYVCPEHQGKGVGRMLMDYVIREARKLGYRMLYLDTFRKEPGPQRLYSACGFTECAPYNDYPADRMLFMEMRL